MLVLVIFIQPKISYTIPSPTAGIDGSTTGRFISSCSFDVRLQQASLAHPGSVAASRHVRASGVKLGEYEMLVMLAVKP